MTDSKGTLSFVSRAASPSKVTFVRAGEASRSISRNFQTGKKQVPNTHKASRDLECQVWNQAQSCGGGSALKDTGLELWFRHFPYGLELVS